MVAARKHMEKKVAAVLSSKRKEVKRQRCGKIRGNHPSRVNRKGRGERESSGGIFSSNPLERVLLAAGIPPDSGRSTEEQNGDYQNC